MPLSVSTRICTRMESISKDSGDVACDAFTPHFFKPTYCIHCFKKKSVHSIKMPSQQNTVNGQSCHGIQESGKPSLGSVSAKASLWIKAATSGDAKNGISGGSFKANRKPVLRSCFEPQTTVLQSADDKLCHSKRNNGNVQNAYQPYPVVKNHLSSKGQVSVDCNRVHGRDLPLKSDPAPVSATNGQTTNMNGGLNHNAAEGNIYEAIYPCDGNVADFDNQANMILESSKISQRSNSDASSHLKEKKRPVRRVSTPATVIPKSGPSPDVLEFQKLAGHLKHTGRRDCAGSSTEGEVRSINHTSQQKKKKLFPLRRGFSQVDTQGDLPNKDRKEPPQMKLCDFSSSSQVKTNAKAYRTHKGLPQLDKTCYKSSASSTSSGEFGSDEGTKSRSSSVNSCSVAPVVPVRTESKRRSKETVEKPGFTLDALLPDSITIISADGTKEVVTAKGIFQTSGKDGASEGEAVTRAGSDTSVSNKTLEDVSSQRSLPNDGEVEPDKPFSSGLSSCSDLPYEVITIAPLNSGDNEPPSPNNLNGAEQVPEGTDNGDGNKPVAREAECNKVFGKGTNGEVSNYLGGQDGIPPFPVILHGDSEHKANRNSGNYKVPIFIKHQDYDNLGTVLADQDYEAMQIRQPPKQTVREKTSDSQTYNEVFEDQYYLKPTDHEDISESPSDAINEDEYELVSHSPNPMTQHSEEEKPETEVEVHVETPERTRSKTHPMFCKEGHLVSGVLPHPTPASQNKMKRTAPRPPEFSKEDTMPRVPPPPPPTDESRRLSKDLQEGILRYHRAAHASKGSFSGMKGSEFEKQMKSQKQLLKSESKSVHSSGSERKESPNVNKEAQNEDIKVVENAPLAERKHKGKPVLNVSASKGRSAPKPMISPPRTHLLHQYLSDSPPSSSPQESKQKEKKSLLFWKKRKRKDDGGSPEREYNTEIVTQWLEKLDESTHFTQRHSWERMEVINAYKGQQTAVIGYKGQVEENNARDPGSPEDQSNCNGKRKAPKPPQEMTSSSDSASQPSPKPLERKKSKENSKLNEVPRDECSITTSSSDQTNKGMVSLPVKPPPRTSSQRRRRETIHESPEYVNLAFLKQSMTPPAKPHRRGRGARSLTTGFENLPSTTKRMAPKAPDRDAIDCGKAEFFSTSDPESTANDPSDGLDASVPLKSALKKKTSGGLPPEANDGDTPPKRPVRLVHANSDPVDDHHNSGLPKTGYVNLEVKQIDFGGTSDTSDSQEAGITLEQIQSLQRQTLARLGELYPTCELTKEMFVGRSWEDFVIHERTLSFSDEKTFCFRAELREHLKEFGIMVFRHQTHLEKILEAARELETFPPHPNVLNVVHSFRAALPLYLFTDSQDEASQRESRGPSSVRSDAVVVITSQVPTSSAVHFIEESNSGGRESDESHEACVSDMVLQVCRGLSHVQRHEPSHSLEGLKQESLLCLGKGSGVWILNPLVIETLSSSIPRRRNSVVSHLTDKCCEFDLGILIYELLHQANPFSVRTSLMSRNYAPEDLPALPEKSLHSARLMSLVCELLRRCPEERASASEAVEIIYAQKFCHSLPSSASELRAKFDGRGFSRLIAMKQTEIVCSLANQLCVGLTDKFGISEKLDFLFWSELDCIKLEKGLTKLIGLDAVSTRRDSQYSNSDQR